MFAVLTGRLTPTICRSPRSGVSAASSADQPALSGFTPPRRVIGPMAVPVRRSLLLPVAREALRPCAPGRMAASSCRSGCDSAPGQRVHQELVPVAAGLLGGTGLSAALGSARHILSTPGHAGSPVVTCAQTLG